MKKLICLIPLFVIFFILNSCDSFIDLKPRDRISSQDYWGTSSELEKYIIQFYPRLGVPGPLTEDLNTDNEIYVVPGVIINGERSLSTGGWTNEWSIIRDINIFLENYKKCKDPFDEFKQYVGEAYFFRAWFYFGLFQKYGKLPWISKPLDANSPELSDKRLSRTVIADSILSDIDKAISLLPIRSKVGNARLNKETALAFKTRVALYEGSWEKYHANTPFGTKGADPDKYFSETMEATKELMNNNQYIKGIYNTGNPNTDYLDLFGMSNMSDIKEILFYKAYNISQDIENTTQQFTTYNPHGYGLTWSLISSYLEKDGKPYNYLNLAKTVKGSAFLTQIAKDADPRLKQTIWIPGTSMGEGGVLIFDKPYINNGVRSLCPTGFQIRKTVNPHIPPAPDAESVSETGYIYFRYAEVLLNYAEALYELDHTIAFEQLNLLRRRAGMPDFTVIPQSAMPDPVNYGYPISDELYAIRRERRVELVLEGRRQPDYMRWAAASLFMGERPKGYPFDQSEFPGFHPLLDDNGLIDYFKNRLPNGYQFREGQDYLFPIPQDELTLNPNLKQNPGW